MLALWRILTQTWMAFVVFMFGLTWPFGFLGQPAPIFLDPMIGPWIRGVWFVAGAIMWAGILSVIVRMILIDGAGVSPAGARKAEIVLIEICWTVFCVFYLLAVITAG